MTTPIPYQAFESDHAGVLGKTGSGKSSTVKTMVEKIHDQGGPVCILDPIKSDHWGLTSNAAGTGPGLPFVVFGGPMQKLPLPPTAGAAIGKMVASGTLRYSILDMSEMTDRQRSRFYVEFAEAVFKHNARPLHLVLEEADVFAPKERNLGEESMSVHWSSRLARAGRSKGIRLIVSCQRVAKLHNDVLGSCATLIVHRLIMPADQKPVLDWLKSAAKPETTKMIAESLATLKKGEAWVYAPEQGILERQQVPLFRTFDNAKTPATSDKAHQVKTAAVDVEQIREAMAEAIKTTEENDPKKLKARIAELEKAAARETTVWPPVDVNALEMAARTECRREMLEDAEDLKRKITAAFDAAMGLHQKLWMAVNGQNAVPPPATTTIELCGTKYAVGVDLARDLQKPINFNKPIARMESKTYTETPRPTPSPHASGSPPGESALGGGREELSGPAKTQVALVAQYPPGGSSMRGALAELAKAGLIQYPATDTVDTTKEGDRWIDHNENIPVRLTLQDLHRAIEEKLTGPAAAVFDILIQKPNTIAMNRNIVADLAGYPPGGSSMRGALAELSNMGLIEYPDKATVKLVASVVFPEGLR
jgi:energy-coupling factor transporter ATP-binding protein EcfA2